MNEYFNPLVGWIIVFGFLFALGILLLIAREL